MDKNVKTFNLFNAAQHLLEGMKFLDYVKNNETDIKEKEMYVSMLVALKNIANALCDVIEKENNISRELGIDDEIINYIDEIQKEIRGEGKEKE
jgi:hypothetical protein